MLVTTFDHSGGRSRAAKPVKRETSGGGVQAQDEGDFDDDDEDGDGDGNIRER